MQPRELAPVDDALHRLHRLNVREERFPLLPSDDAAKPTFAREHEGPEAGRVELVDRGAEPRDGRLTRPLAGEHPGVMERGERRGPRHLNPPQAPELVFRL